MLNIDKTTNRLTSKKRRCEREVCPLTELLSRVLLIQAKQLYYYSNIQNSHIAKCYNLHRIIFCIAG